MRKKHENPAQIRLPAKNRAGKRQFLAALAAALLLFSQCAGIAQEAASPDGQGFPQMAEGMFPAGADFPMLTEEQFAVGDLPEGYLEEAAQAGRVEKVRYFVSNENQDVKSVMVYLPQGYDASESSFNVLYILHAASGTPKNYLDPDRGTPFQCLLDHMIADGKLEPLIVVAASYYPSEGFTQFLPLEKQVEVTASFPRELVEDIIPAVESKYRTWAASTGTEGIRASRDHRGIAGFSLGGVTTWYVFLQQMQAFRWFLPISEASWDDGEGGTSGIWDSSVSAQVLCAAVLEQGYAKDDFRLFVATGTEDEAFDVSTSQMVSLLEYADLFKPGDNTSCSMMIGGTHTIQAVYTYLYHILPSLFSDK
ncbi:MAG: hypothetical protein IK099_16290 [Clostridia bacterium]|nr:hypothetical protein [Clostridia bacterium]